MTHRHATGDGFGGILVIGIDPVLGATALAACQTASRRLISSVVLGGYVETHLLLFPADGDPALTAELVMTAFAGSAPGAERYFCGVLMVTGTEGCRVAAEMALSRIASSYDVRIRSLVISDIEHSNGTSDRDGPIQQAVEALAHQLWMDAYQSPERGASLSHLRAHLAVTTNDVGPTSTRPQPEAMVQSGSDATFTPDAKTEVPRQEEQTHAPDQIASRNPWYHAAIKLPTLKRRKIQPANRKPAVSPVHLVYYVLLTDASTVGPRRRRARAAIRAIDTALGDLPESDALRCRYMAGGATIEDRTPLRRPGAAGRHNPKSSATPYISVSRIASDLEQTFARDSARYPTSAARLVLSIIVVAASTPMIDASALALVTQLSVDNQVIWIVLDDESAALQEQLGAYDVHLCTDHPEIADEIVQMVHGTSRPRQQPNIETGSDIRPSQPIQTPRGNNETA